MDALPNTTNNSTLHSHSPPQITHSWKLDLLGASMNSSVIAGVNSQLTWFALKLAKRDLRILVGVLTGHTTLNRHLAIMKIRSDSTCSACGEDEETTLRYLGCCWANPMLRHTIMGSYCLQSEELGRVTPHNLGYIGVAHWAKIYGWPQHWVALNETTHPEGTKAGVSVSECVGFNVPLDTL